MLIKIAKKFPGLKSLVKKLKETIRWYSYKTLIPCLYPVSTNVPLVRFGPHGDGGYLIPNDLDGISACFSPGVSFISGFEKDCADLGIKVFLADASVDAPANTHPLFEFSKKFIGGHSGKDFITLDEWVEQSLRGTCGDLMMQMDIEGFEYEALDNASTEVINRFRIIVIEFHGLDNFDSVKQRVFKKLLSTHTCVHIHPNNCCPVVKVINLEVPPLMEFTFLRKDRIYSQSYRSDFPHPFDSDNTNRASISLPDCWYRKNH